MMLDELATSLAAYDAAWVEAMHGQPNAAFFRQLQPTAVGWKVADATDYTQCYAEVRPACDKMVETYMNDRWIAKLHLSAGRLSHGIQVVKLMQRRPDSSDPAGLDHVDFYYPPAVDASAELQRTSLRWTHESNEVIAGYEWLSIWFAGREAKLKPYTVLGTVATELQGLETAILLNKPQTH